MLFNSIVGTATELMGAGGGVWLATQATKLFLLAKLDGDQTSKVRAVAGVLSAIAVALMGITNQSLQPTDLIHVVSALSAFAATWGLSHGIHTILHPKVFKSTDTPTPPVDDVKP